MQDAAVDAFVAQRAVESFEKPSRGVPRLSRRRRVKNTTRVIIIPHERARVPRSASPRVVGIRRMIVDDDLIVDIMRTVVARASRSPSSPRARTTRTNVDTARSPVETARRGPMDDAPMSAETRRLAERTDGTRRRTTNDVARGGGGRRERGRARR